VSVNKVTARFVPQEWVGSYSIDHGGDIVFFDATDVIDTMSLRRLRNMEDDSYDGDFVWRSHEASLTNPHDGPFKVILKDEVRKYVKYRLRAVRGERPEVRAMYATLQANWDGTIDDLFTTARILTKNVAAASPALITDSLSGTR
jgi:hypothetical protein